MKTKSILVLGAIVLLCTSCQDDDSILDLQESSLEMALKQHIVQAVGSLESITMPDSDDFTAIPKDLNNILSAEKVVLGQFLFHETGMAIEAKHTNGLGTYSCASCHHFKAGFQSGMKQGIGDGGMGFGLKGESRGNNPLYPIDSLDVQPIRSPSVLHVAYQEVMLWNGQFGASGVNMGTSAQWVTGTPKETNKLGFEGVETQAIAGLGVHRLNVDTAMVRNGPYKPYFDQAFPDVPESDRYTLTYAGLAIAAYERTLFANEAPFQKFLRGEVHSMTNDELEGGILFYGKGQCYQCHSGPGMNGMDFHALGMNDFSGNDFFGTVDEATKKGRGGFTENPTDYFKFKTPQLYNLKDVAFLGHGGSFPDVKSVVAYKNKAVAENPNVPENQISSQFIPLALTGDEVDKLTLFIENALYDADLFRYVPEITPLGSACFPNADKQSMQEIGCN